MDYKCSRPTLGTTPLTRRHALQGIGAGLMTGLLGSCANIPISENIHRHSENLTVNTDKNTPVRALGPQEGAGAEAIIEGFIRAGADSTDDYSVARQFLTKEFASRWNPADTTHIYSNTVQVTESTTRVGIYSAKVHQSALVTDKGLTSTFAEPSVEDIEFSLEQVQGQWRISECPNGLWLDGGEFDRVFSPYRLYFYDSTYSHAVPDIRRFPYRDGQLGILLQTVLSGPATYLQDVVTSTLVAGMKLQKAETSEREAQVSITGPTLNALTLARLRQQVGYVLSNFSSISRFELEYNGQTVEEEQPTGFQQAQLNPEVSPRVIGFQDNKLALGESYTSSDIKTVSPTTISYPTSPAMNYEGTVFACLGDKERSLYLVKDHALEKLASGKTMTPPSFDAFGWLWVSEEEGAIRAYNTGASGQSERQKGIDIPVSWRRGMNISSLQISRDGARVVLVGTHDSTTVVIMSGVVRDEHGTPKNFTEPVLINASITPQLAIWAGEQNLVVANTENGESEITTLSGEETKFDRLEGLKGISAAGDTNSVFAHSSDGSCYRLEEHEWTRADISLRDISFAG